MRPIIRKFDVKKPISGICLYPFVFIFKGGHIAHELSHWDDIHDWYLKAWWFGVFAWYFCYLFALPFIWNPLRKKTEIKAYGKQGINEASAIKYYLRSWRYGWLI